MTFASPPPALAQPAQPTLGSIVLLGALTAMGAVSIDLYLPSLPAIGRGFGVGAAAVQQTMSAFFIGMAVGGLVYGPVSDRIGRRPALLIGLVVYAAASLGCALAPGIGWLIGGRLVQALGACAGPVVARAVVRDRYHHQDSARIFSLLTLVLGVAPMIAPTVGAWLVTFATWRTVFAVLAAFGVAMTVAVAWRLDESRSGATTATAGHESVAASYVALFRQRRLLGYLLGGALNGAALFTYVSGAPGLLITRYHFTPHAFAAAFAAIAVGVIGSSQVNRSLLRRYESDHILAVATLVGVAAGAALVVAAFTLGQWPVLVCLFVALTSYGFVAANTTAGALAVDPSRAGATSSLIGSASFGAGALAAGIAGAFDDGTPHALALVIAVAMAGAAVSFHLLALRQEV